MPSLSILLRYSFTWRSDTKIKLYNIIAIIANVAIIDIDQLDIVDVPLQDQHWALFPPWPSPTLLLVWNEITMIAVCISADRFPNPLIPKWFSELMNECPSIEPWNNTVLSARREKSTSNGHIPKVIF